MTRRRVPVVICGFGGHGRDIAGIADALGLRWEPADDDLRKFPGGRMTSYLHRGEPFVVGVNDPSTRRRLAVGSNPTRLIHPAAVVSPDADLSPGVVVGAGTTVGPQVTLGPHVHVGPNCSLTRSTVGAFTTISPGVDIAGDVTIGEECLIGVGATVSNLVTIGDRCVIGAGAVVISDVPDDTTVAGVPAKPLQRKGAASMKCMTIRGVAATRQFCELEHGHDGDHQWSKSYADVLRERVAAAEREER